jgi:GNAT superfamily N-acetyltransferase
MAQPATDSRPVIRTYEARDYDAVWSLHREGIMATTPEYLDVYEKYEDDLHDIENVYLGEGANFWVAETAGWLVAMAAVQRIDAGTGRLRRMRVSAAWRRRGLARLLLETAELFCREQGYGRIILDTTEQQTAAHRLYETAGFTRTGERSLGPFRVFFYEKHLT